MKILQRIIGWFRKPKPLREIPKPHALDLVCEEFDCRYERSVFPTGEVQIRLIRHDATLTAVGSTTSEAVMRIVTKARLCWGVL